jgi:hypothetical protein
MHFPWLLCQFFSKSHHKYQSQAVCLRQTFALCEPITLPSLSAGRIFACFLGMSQVSGVRIVKIARPLLGLRQQPEEVAGIFYQKF